LAWTQFDPGDRGGNGSYVVARTLAFELRPDDFSERVAALKLSGTVSWRVDESFDPPGDRERELVKALASYDQVRAALSGQDPAAVRLAGWSAIELGGWSVAGGPILLLRDGPNSKAVAILGPHGTFDSDCERWTGSRFVCR